VISSPLTVAAKGSGVGEGSTVGTSWLGVVESAGDVDVPEAPQAAKNVAVSTKIVK